MINLIEIENINKKVIDFFEGNPVLNIISLILASLGIIFTIYFYFKSKKTRIPTYIVKTINLVREKIQKFDLVEILYSGVKVNNLSISKVAIWNGGKETINSGDIASNNPFKIKIKNDFEILDAKILFQKNDANDFKIRKSDDNRFITITFDYFDFEEGIVLQIFHTGNDSNDIYIDGKIKSVNKISRREFSSAGAFIPDLVYRLFKKDKEGMSRRTMKTVLAWSIILGGIVICCLAISLLFLDSILTGITEPIETSPFLIIFMALPGLLYILSGYRLIKRKIPKGFDIFNEEL